MRSSTIVFTLRRFLTLGLLAAAGLVLPAGTAHAQLPEAVRHFDEGNRRYTDGDYRGAVAAYDEALAAGYTTGALYYNMGNAYFRLDELGQAIRAYERARRLLPDRPELLHNLEIARARRVDQFSQLPEPFWRPWWRALVLFAGAGGLFAAGLVGYLAAAGLAGYRLWTGAGSPWLRRGIVLAAVAGLLLIGLGLAASADQALDRRAVVLATSVELREAPRADAPAALAIHEGLVIDVLDRQDRWVEVRLPNGTTGWVEAEAVGRI